MSEATGDDPANQHPAGSRPAGTDPATIDAARWERLVDATPGIDPWCSGPDWVLPAFTAYAPGGAVPWIDDHGELGAALLARYPGADDRGGLDPDPSSAVMAGLEPLWGFACPLIGPEPERLLEAVVRRLVADPTWRRVVLPGFVDPDRLRSVALHLFDLAERLAARGRDSPLEVGLAEGISRRVVDLDGDADAWWGRRSSKFRRNLRRARRRADELGVGFTDLHDDPDGSLLDRLVAIEAQGWKGAEASGIAAPEMQRFYRDMVRRLDATGRLRASIAVGPDGRDLAFILGGVRGATYRGLQLSYVADAAALSLGHLLQWRAVDALAEEGVRTYDLGMDMDYKAGWSDRLVASHVLVLQRTV